MESGLTVDVDDSGTQRKLKALAGAAGASPNLMRAIGYAMRTRTLLKFREERGPRGSWKPLAESTKAARRTRRDKPEKSTRILQDTGLLRNSIHAVPARHSVDIGTAVHYSIFHQEGAPRAGIVPRPFLYVDDADATRLESLVVAYLERFVR